MSLMIRSRIALAGAAVAALSLMAACGSGGGGDDEATPEEAADATIHIGSLYEPQNLSNVDGGGQGVTEALNGNVYEGLFRLADDGSVENLLAEDYSVSDDGLTYTVTLRDGVTFQSGAELTSEDVKASVERVTAETSQSARKSSFEPIVGIETPDDQTVVFTLSTPSISFPYNLSYIWVVDSEATDLKTTADGTGPYTVGEWTRGSSLTLTRADDYWGEPAANGEVVFQYFTDASALSNALLTNEVDLVTSIQSPDALAQFESNPDFTISEGTSTTKELLAFNDRVAPFDKVEVRKAVYSAIDREKLLSSIWGDYGTLIGSMVPPTDPWYIEDLTQENPYDPALAKSLLTEAGLPDGFTFTLDTPTYDPHPVVAEFVQSELAKVGITVEINPISADEWYTKVFQERDFEATLQEHVNDRDVVWYGNPDFYWGYDNPDVTTWVAEAEAAATPEEQTAKLKQVNEQIAKDAASAWLYLYPQIVVASSDVSGYPVNGLNSQFFAYDIVKG
ncbi:ABC transporter substrate-binding protein [Georgenia yuyongxinii]|uniref:ABC transporter substrate-binding protein n=2 Tax=Georgenia yuyongxinii TaxID=2589797 RepID=A0A5B8C611_9MICO|nr:ABC transporter substrate-binding protein [Georgenia yuyongxinii]